MDKDCSKCGRTQPLANFPPGRTCRDGRQNVCRECKREADRHYSRYQRSRRKARENQRRWREKKRQERRLTAA